MWAAHMSIHENICSTQEKLQPRACCTKGAFVLMLQHTHTHKEYTHTHTKKHEYFIHTKHSRKRLPLQGWTLHTSQVSASSHWSTATQRIILYIHLVFRGRMCAYAEEESVRSRWVWVRSHYRGFRHNVKMNWSVWQLHPLHNYCDFLNLSHTQYKACERFHWLTKGCKLYQNLLQELRYLLLKMQCVITQNQFRKTTQFQ